MKVEIEIKDGLYEVYNGDDCDNYPYRALMAIYGENCYITEFTVHSYLFDEMKSITEEECACLLSKLNVDSLKKI